MTATTTDTMRRISTLSHSLPAPRRRPATVSLGRAFGDPSPANAGIRNYEIAALRHDGSLFIGQQRAPAQPLFESAFSAFARGTVIQSTRGPVAIEDLQPGDQLITVGGPPAEIVWIGSSTFVPADAGRRTPLIRIMPDSLGNARPATPITVGPSARILQTPHHLRARACREPMLTPVREFVHGVHVINVTPPTPVRLFHLCLAEHAAIIAGGLEMETFHPGLISTQMMTRNVRDLFLSMFPQIAHISDFGPLAHPRMPEPVFEGTEFGATASS